MVNYGKTKIYKIWSILGDNIYIGATTKKYLSSRMDEHRYKYRKYIESENKTSVYTSFIIFDEYGIDNCFIELLESKECITKDEQIKLEGEWIRKSNCVNKIIPDGTNKEWREKNKENLKEKKKEWYENNKEKIHQKCICLCGSEYQQSSKTRHEKTIKHLNFIQQSQ
jgi:hypothetical protein